MEKSQLPSIDDLLSKISTARQNQNLVEEQFFTDQLFCILALNKFQLCPINDYVVLSLMKPSQNYQRRFTLLSFMLYSEVALQQLSDPQNPKYMSADKILAVKEFLTKIFYYKKDQDIGMLNNKKLDDDSFDDQVNKYLNHFPLWNESYKDTIKEQDDNTFTVQVNNHNLSIPSINSFLNWEQFEIVNFDQLRNLTNLFEFNSPIIEDAIQIHKTFPTLEAAQQFAEKYKDYPLGLSVARCGNWHLNTPCEKNQQALQILGTKTKILSDTLEACQYDKEQHSVLLQQYVQQQQEKSLKEFSTDNYEQEQQKEIYERLKNNDYI